MTPLATTPCKRLAASIALLVTLAPGTVLAQATGRTTVGNFTYTLTDLDPLDGVSPTLTFMPMPHVPPPGLEREGAHLNVSYGDPYVVEGIERYATGTETLSHSFQPNADVSVTGTLSGREQALTHEIHLNAFARSDGTNLWTPSASAHTGRMEFVLSPNTAVVFNLTVDVEGSVTHHATFDEYYQTATALLLYSGTFPFSNLGGEQRVYLAHSAPGYLATLDATEIVSASYDNVGPNPFSGAVALYVWSNAVSGLPVTSSVPEPGTPPMLAAGMLVIGLWRCARRKAAS